MTTSEDLHRDVLEITAATAEYATQPMTFEMLRTLERGAYELLETLEEIQRIEAAKISPMERKEEE